jgi:hypothetical protein
MRFLLAVYVGLYAAKHEWRINDPPLLRSGAAGKARMTKIGRGGSTCYFGIRHSSFLRHSSFGFRHFPQSRPSFSKPVGWHIQIGSIELSD